MVFSAAAVLLLARSGHGAVAQAPPRTVWDGIYVEEQASRGEDVFLKNCSYCHGTDLGGGDDPNGPALKGNGFLSRWRGKSVANLFHKIAETMPANNPGILTADSCSEVISYILKANGIPSGSSPLPNDPERLEQVIMTRSR
jgi:mono/diheme cytochrome c family protein